MSIERGERLNELRGLSRRSNQGHASLFIREPLSDRLILVYSTNNHLNPGIHSKDVDEFLEKPDKNYDAERKLVYYDLRNTLAQALGKERDDLDCRSTRGLTGWVALSGHPLRRNRTKDLDSTHNDITKTFVEDYPSTKTACEIYGAPQWGSRVAEFSVKKYPNWQSRYLAVPVHARVPTKSDPEPPVVGVLRYTCERFRSSPLTDEDTFFLKSMVFVLSTLLNLGRIRIHAARKDLFELKKRQFEETGDFAKFLKFIAWSLRSKIAALYICLNVDGKETLRLFDAHGISDRPGALRARGELSDYSAANDPPGLTWSLFNWEGANPREYKTVLQPPGDFAGFNTLPFYRFHFSRIFENEEELIARLSSHKLAKDLLEDHTVSLLGTPLPGEGRLRLDRPLRSGEPRIGVLKVEFPSTIESDQHFVTTSDQEFFMDCAVLLDQELKEYKRFIDGEWFDQEKADPREFVRYMAQIFDSQLIAQKEDARFWQRVLNYEKNNRDSIDGIENKYAYHSPSHETVSRALKLLNESDPPISLLRQLFREQA